MKKAEWFSTWFDSHYYHILYKNRDDSEAGLFLTSLLDYLNPPKNAFMLDLACGSGRHANFLAKQGYNVVGVDLSENSIIEASKNKLPNSRFFTMDMREKIDFINFNYVFNLFSSFGYFETDEENYKVIEAVKHCLKKDGVYVIDFLNSRRVADNLVKSECKTVDGIDFNIERTIRDNYVIKIISFEDKNENFRFIEQVRLYDYNEFNVFFKDAGFEIIDVFGNYQLEEFDKKNSDRLILVAKSTN